MLPFYGRALSSIAAVHADSRINKTMDNFDMNYSGKNIPLPSKREYLKRLLEMTESFIKRLRWKALFFLRKESESTSSDDSSDNSDNEDRYNETFGLKSKRTPPQIQELMPFEADLLDMVEHIQFKEVKDKFQNDLKADVNKIITSPDVL